MNSIVRFLSTDEGVTQIEYALLGVLVAVAIGVGASSLGETINSMYGWIAATVTAILT